MAPPENTFPVSELEHRLHFYDKDYRTKIRKLPNDFDLKRDCPLHELVQYSCTSVAELEERVLMTGQRARMECFPFTRLFRKCTDIYGKEFNVETTAWEGRHKWVKKNDGIIPEELEVGVENKSTMFAKYGDYFLPNGK